DLLMECLDANRKGFLMHEPAPPLPAYSRFPFGAVCGPTAAGLVTGKIGNELALGYSTAMTFMGLREAARFATAHGHAQDAKRWMDAAAGLQRAYLAALDGKAANNPGLLKLVQAYEPFSDPIAAARSAKQIRSQAWGDLATQQDFMIGAVWPSSIGATARE